MRTCSRTTNTAVVIDWSKYCTELPGVGPEGRACVVEPGPARRVSVLPGFADVPPCPDGRAPG
ncbi:hypothetical protein ACF1BE_07825 [Streptomyces sp. NPDC014991]|uniref:hypothetical protein n=1 Tax=Streptomyces sp. NPDC014991 TaxID=3364935 RepID=UPI0036FD5AE8